MPKKLALLALLLLWSATLAAAPFDVAVQRLRNRRIDLSLDGVHNTFRIVFANINPITGDFAGTWMRIPSPSVPVISTTSTFVGSLELTGDPNVFGFTGNVVVRDIGTPPVRSLRYEGSVIAPADAGATFAAGVEKSWGQDEPSSGAGATSGEPDSNNTSGSSGSAVILHGSPRPFSTARRQST